MKKIHIKIFMVIAVASFIFSSTLFSFADENFTLVESYPEDGQTNASVENLGVKLTFSSALGKESNQSANNKCFKIIDAEGNELQTAVYYNPKDPNQVLILHTGDQEEEKVQGNSEYKLVISGDLIDDNGNVLGSDKTISFKTINQKLNTIIYMVMMGVMMIGMIVFTSIQTKKNVAGAKANNGSAPAFNPYKEAKRTGKPVSEVIAAHEKEVQKKFQKAEKAAKKEESLIETEPEEENGNYKVKGARPIAAAGGKTISGRKALAEERAKEEERLAKRRANRKRKK